MANNELSHWGIKGMKWGVRRFQNKDGSLTPAGKKRRWGKEKEPEETVEQRKARLKTSTDASELYKNRDILTTAEIKERLDRIDTERRLGEVAAKTKKTGYDYINGALKAGRKVNEVYEFMNTPVMKALKQKLGVEKVEQRLGLDKIYEMRDKLSDKDLADALKRASTEKAIKKILDEERAAAKADTSAKKDDEPEVEKVDAEFVGYRDTSGPRSTNGRNFVTALLEEPKD